MKHLKKLKHGIDFVGHTNDRNGSMVTAYTTTRHLLVDLDDSTLFQSTGLAILLSKEYPDLGDCLVVSCGDNSHHLVFDNILDFDYLNRVIRLLWDFRYVNDEVRYFRDHRGDFSLRVSEKLTVDEDKQIPRPVYYISNNQTPQRDYQMKNYLELLALFNPTVSELLLKPLPLFPIRHLVSPEIHVHSLKESSGL